MEEGDDILIYDYEEFEEEYFEEEEEGGKVPPTFDTLSENLKRRLSQASDEGVEPSTQDIVPAVKQETACLDEVNIVQTANDEEAVPADVKLESATTTQENVAEPAVLESESVAEKVVEEKSFIDEVEFEEEDESKPERFNRTTVVDNKQDPDQISSK